MKFGPHYNSAADRVCRELAEVRTRSPLLPFVAALLVTGLAARADLYAFTFVTDEAAPFGAGLTFEQAWQAIWVEPIIAFFAFVPAWLVWRLGHLYGAETARVRHQQTLTAALAFLVWMAGVTYGLQAHLIDALNAPFSVRLLKVGTQGFSLRDLWHQLAPVDALYLLLPVPIFLLFNLAPRLAETAIVTIVLACVMAPLALRVDKAPSERTRPVLANSLAFVGEALVTAFFNPPTPKFPAESRWRKDQTSRLALLDRAFGHQTPSTCAACGPTPRPALATNVVFVIMESVGTYYAFAKPRGTRAMAMPKLGALRAQGLSLPRHIASANMSANAIFSMFSGLYPWPEPGLLATTADLHIPSLFSLVGTGTDSFLVSPGSLKWFFPYAFMKNTGVKELWDCDNISARRPRPLKTSLHELDGVDFFLKRLARAKPPFVATYYSFTAHHPYPDPDPPWNLRPPRSRRSRYLNGLSMLDAQIDRIVQAVYRKTRPEDTLIVIVGDHGEAFGQHPGNWVHGQATFMENIATPALLIHPSLVGREVKGYTSHVDILPTVLDALGVAYEPRLLQGQSLIERAPERDYVYVVGQENAVTSLSRKGRKVTANLESGLAEAYDLRLDPTEMQAQPVTMTDRQLQGLIQFKRFQAWALLRYKQRAKEGKPFAARLADPTAVPTKPKPTRL